MLSPVSTSWGERDRSHAAARNDTLTLSPEGPMDEPSVPVLWAR